MRATPESGWFPLISLLNRPYRCCTKDQETDLLTSGMSIKEVDSWVRQNLWGFNRPAILTDISQGPVSFARTHSSCHREKCRAMLCQAAVHHNMTQVPLGGLGMLPPSCFKLPCWLTFNGKPPPKLLVGTNPDLNDVHQRVPD